MAWTGLFLGSDFGMEDLAMSNTTIFLAGVAAHVVSMLAAQYARWLLSRAAEGVDPGFRFLDDLRAFAQWFMHGTASRFSGRSRYGDNDEWQPELFGG
jgi:hypothetical protein